MLYALKISQDTSTVAAFALLLLYLSLSYSLLTTTTSACSSDALFFIWNLSFDAKWICLAFHLTISAFFKLPTLFSAALRAFLQLEAIFTKKLH